MSRGRTDRGQDENAAHPRIVATYDYTDEANRPLFQVVRYEPKAFKQRRQDPKTGRWTWRLGDVRRVLYRLQEVEWAVGTGDPIYIVEGEKDADALTAAGVTATCNPGGAGKWRDDYAKVLRGGTVVVVADADPAGRKHAAEVAASVSRVAKSVTVVEPFEGKDAADHLAAGGSVEDFVPVRLTDERQPPADAPRFDQLLERARDRSLTEGRNAACMWLVHQLRDNQFEEDVAWATVERFQASVNGTGSHAFPVSEAKGVFEKHFFTEAREPWGQVAPDSYAATDYGNAERLVARHGSDLRYVHAWRSWLVWDGRRWKPDATAEVERRTKETIRHLYQHASETTDDQDRKSLAGFARRSEAAPRLRAMLDLARSEGGVPVEPRELDADAWSLNVKNGRINLRTGDLGPHDQRHYDTKLAPVAYDALADTSAWESFLQRIMPEPDDRAFLQRAVGYSLTGDVSEHVLFIPFGGGDNGKTVFLEAVRAVLGDYAQQAPSELILAKRPGGIPSDVARLQGARFVSASESEESSRLAESLVKQLTGGDRIAARHIYAEWFEFNPTHKIWLATNHKPVVYGTDHAIWRRLRLIPFTVTIPPGERVKDYFGQRLADELPGILRWAVEGCLAWQSDGGLTESRNVLDATAEYRSESDFFGMFIEEVCELGDELEVSAAALFSEYELWAHVQNLKPMNLQMFSRKLRERGFEKVRKGKANTPTWLGITVPERIERGKLRIVPGSGA